MSVGKILVVDDEPQIRRVLKTTLSAQGYEVFDARTGKDALESVRAGRFDLILLDVRLPDANGWELAREIKRLHPKLPVIAQTAYAMSTDRQKSEEAGCDGYLSKPIRKSELFQEIAKYMLQ